MVINFAVRVVMLLFGAVSAAGVGRPGMTHLGGAAARCCYCCGGAAAAPHTSHALA